MADRYGGQLGHGAVGQVCLAHLLRDANYAIEASDVGFAPAVKRLLLRAVAIGRRREAMKDSTLAHYRADLDRRLGRLLCGHRPRSRQGVDGSRRCGETVPICSVS